MWSEEANKHMDLSIQGAFGLDEGEWMYVHGKRSQLLLYTVSKV